MYCIIKLGKYLSKKSTNSDSFSKFYDKAVLRSCSYMQQVCKYLCEYLHLSIYLGMYAHMEAHAEVCMHTYCVHISVYK